MSELRYPARALTADFTRSGIGIALTGGPLFLDAVSGKAAWALGIIAGFFLIFGIRSFFNRYTRILIEPDGISRSRPWPKKIAWDRLEGLNLRYYTTSKGQTGGWMQLVLKGGGVAIQIESTIDDFMPLVTTAAEAANQNKVELTPATISNLQALKIMPPRDCR
jgi:hypothetical protein